MKVNPRFYDEWRLIPRPAKIIAVLVPIIGFAFLTGALTKMVTGATASLAIVIGGLFAIYVLLIGYVYADAKRRQMRQWMWMLIVILVPNLLGFVLYFLLRTPMQSKCPGCGHSLDADDAYCPDCGRQIGQSCPSCSRSVASTASFCQGCGHNLKETVAPPD